MFLFFATCFTYLPTFFSFLKFRYWGGGEANLSRVFRVFLRYSHLFYNLLCPRVYNVSLTVVLIPLPPARLPSILSPKKRKTSYVTSRAPYRSRKGHYHGFHLPLACHCHRRGGRRLARPRHRDYRRRVRLDRHRHLRAHSGAHRHDHQAYLAGTLHPDKHPHARHLLPRREHAASLSGKLAIQLDLRHRVLHRVVRVSICGVHRDFHRERDIDCRVRIQRVGCSFRHLVHAPRMWAEQPHPHKEKTSGSPGSSLLFELSCVFAVSVI